jgi:hypothetical protein
MGNRKAQSSDAARRKLWQANIRNVSMQIIEAPEGKDLTQLRQGLLYSIKEHRRGATPE